MALLPGTSSNPVTVSIQAHGGFSGAVTVSVEGLPAGLNISASTSFSVGAGQSQQITLTASSSATPVSANITFRGTSGSLVQTATLAASVVVPRNSRTNYVRAAGTVNDVLYDAARKQVFATSHGANRVDVFSSVDGKHLASIPVARPYGIDITPDGTKVYVGSNSEELTVIDPVRLEVAERIDFYYYDPVQRSSYVYLVPVTLANGHVLFSIDEHWTTSPGGLIKWDPATGSRVSRWPPGTGSLTFSPLAFPMLTRTADRSRVLVSDGGGVVTLYDVASDSYVAIRSMPETVQGIAANADGSQFVVLGDRDSVYFLDAQLNTLATVKVPSSLGAIIYSFDGARVFVSSGFQSATQYTVLDARTFSVLGSIPCNLTSLPEKFVTPIAVDETDLLFVPNGSGVAFVEMSSPRSLPPSSFAGYVSVNPPHGKPDVPTDVTVTSPFTTQGSEVYFGRIAGIGSSLAGTSLRTKTPALGQKGSVLVTMTHPNGWEFHGVEAFTYGPDVRHILPNVGKREGSTALTLIGKGFSQQTRVTVSLGDSPSQNITPQTNGSDPSLFDVRFLAPAGNPGVVDVVVQTSEGTQTLSRAFQFARTFATFQVTGSLEQLLYDDSRQLLFATNTSQNRVEVFSLANRNFLAAIPVGNAPAKMAITPDRSKLIVTNANSGSLSVIDLSSRTVQNTFPLPVNPEIYPYNIAAVDGNRAFVELRFAGSGGAGKLVEVNLATGATTVRLQQGDSAGIDDNFLVATAEGGFVVTGDTNTSGGNAYTWDSTSNSFQFRGIGWYLYDGAISADGNVIAIPLTWNPFKTHFYNQQLHEVGMQSELPSLTQFDAQLRLGHKLHPSGALLFAPVEVFREGYYAVDVYDVRTGSWRLRIPLPEGLRPGVDSLAVSNDGSLIFANTNSGFVLVELSEVPLSIGHVTPNSGPSAGGTQLTIRGSGFQSGASVELGGDPVVATSVDSNTIRVTTLPASQGPITVTVINPNGDKYRLHAGFHFN